jgi:hypothetical protein
MRDTELTTGERYAIIALEVVRRGRITSRQVCELANLKTRRGACRILNQLSRHVLPMVYDNIEQAWFPIYD